MSLLKKPMPRKVAPLFSEAHHLDARRAQSWLHDRLERSRRLHDGELISEVATISPAMAEVILAECNKGNRSLRAARVAQWAAVITDGRWKLTSQGISFSREGLLNNGQHRLNGIVSAGRPVQMLAVFGEDRSVFDVLDTGAVRGGSDTLHVAGYKNTAVLASAARLLHIVTGPTPGANLSISNDKVREIVEQNPRLEDATTMGSTIGKRLRFSTGAATVAFYLIAEHSDHARRLTFFLDRLREGDGLKRRDPILTLRDGLKDGALDGSVKGSAQRAVAHCAAIILAWNKWARGKTASAGALKWSADQPFPKPE